MTESRTRWGLILMVFGIALILLYAILKAADVGKFGGAADIGGGLLVLAGYCSAGAGLVLLIVGLFDRRSKRRKAGN